MGPLIIGRRALAHALVLACVTCRPSDPSPPAVGVTSASALAAAGPADAGAPSSALCAEVLSHNAAVLGGASPPRGEVFGAACFPTPRGAWALRLDRWEINPKGGLDARTGSWTLVHIDRSGAQVSGKPGRGFVHEVMAVMDYTTTSAVLHDYDGDGEPEILVSVARKENEGPFEAQALVATFQAGAVRELPGLPAQYDDFADVDGDGRPDVLYFPYAMLSEGPCTRFVAREPGPAFVAHARPDGSFSIDDDVARAHVAAQCPKGARPDGGPEPALPELCALFRGATRSEAVAVLGRNCKPPRPKDDGCQAPPGVCFDYAVRRGALDHPPPFRLPR